MNADAITLDGDSEERSRGFRVGVLRIMLCSCI